MIALGSDHAGLSLKLEITELLDKLNIKYKDFGTHSSGSVDYPVYGKKVAEAVKNGEFEKGILICGTGIGISIAANKVKGIRAALCHDVFSAKMTRLHNDANILTLGARVIGAGHALEIVEAFLGTDFSGEERHLARIKMLD